MKNPPNKYTFSFILMLFGASSLLANAICIVDSAQIYERVHTGRKLESDLVLSANSLQLTDGRNYKAVAKEPNKRLKLDINKLFEEKHFAKISKNTIVLDGVTFQRIYSRELKNPNSFVGQIDGNEVILSHENIFNTNRLSFDNPIKNKDRIVYRSISMLCKKGKQKDADTKEYPMFYEVLFWNDQKNYGDRNATYDKLPPKEEPKSDTFVENPIDSNNEELKNEPLITTEQSTLPKTQSQKAKDKSPPPLIAETKDGVVYIIDDLVTVP